MGISFYPHCDTRDKLVKELTQPFENYVCLAHTCRGNILWSVWEIGGNKRIIRCDKMQNGGADHGWGFKGMDESVHPYYYTCPQKYLKMVPEVTNQEWRDTVMEYHRRMNYQLKVGLIIGLSCRAPKFVKLISIRPLVGESKHGSRFRIPKAYFTGHVYENWPE